jgi:hypothetical protein
VGFHLSREGSPCLSVRESSGRDHGGTCRSSMKVRLWRPCEGLEVPWTVPLEVCWGAFLRNPLGMHLGAVPWWVPLVNTMGILPGGVNWGGLFGMFGWRVPCRVLWVYPFGCLSRGSPGKFFWGVPLRDTTWETPGNFPGRSHGGLH